MSLQIALMLGIVLALSHYFSDRFPIHRHRNNVLSFAAGISITYIFLHLLPGSIPEAYGRSLFLSMLLGFSIFHLIEKHTYRHRTKRRRHEIKEVHTAAFFVYHLIIGIVLVGLASTNLLSGFLFFVPIMLHSAISSASLKELHRSVKENVAAKSLLSVSPIIGIILGFYVALSSNAYNLLLGFVAGAMLYIVIRDELPSGRKGRPVYFVAGILLYMLLLVGMTVF